MPAQLLTRRYIGGSQLMHSSTISLWLECGHGGEKSCCDSWHVTKVELACIPLPGFFYLFGEGFAWLTDPCLCCAVRACLWLLQLSEIEVKAIMLQLLSAVQYLHRNGVWHRDIKSANILMTYTNGVRCVQRFSK